MMKRAFSSESQTVEEARHDSEEAAAHLASASHLIGTGDPALASFFTAFTRYANPEDLLHYTGAELAALVKLVCERTALRSPGASIVEVFDPSLEDASFAKLGETILVAVFNDMPFLYDSTTAAIRAEGAHVAAAFHPVIPTTRDSSGHWSSSGDAVSESVIVIALDNPFDQEAAASLKKAVTDVLDDVRVAVRDWKQMLARLAETVAELKRNPPRIAEDELNESLAFLGWLADNHFTFLGSRDYAYKGENGGRLEPLFETGLGVLANPERRIIRRGPDRSSLTPEVRAFLTQPSPIIITKSSSRSIVHRRAPMDYIGVKTFDEKGNLTGERRFVGLFTSTAYSQLASSIPLLRRKIEHVLAGSGLSPSGHDGKALAHVLNTFPRDELFQIGENELLATGLGILNLGERPKVRIFLRVDKFDRFVSALVFLPRERYSGAVRQKIHGLLARAFNGRLSAAMPSLEDETLARIHYIVGRNDGPRPEVDARELEAQIRVAIRTWDDGFADALQVEHGSASAALARCYGEAFPPGYRDAFGPQEAVEDIDRIGAVLSGRGLGGHVSAHVYGLDDDDKGVVHLKLFVKDKFIPLSECLPMFENLGLKVIAEDAFALIPKDAAGQIQTVALQNILMVRADGGAAEIERIKPLLEEAFHSVWAGATESDGFNRLVVTANLSSRDIVILRSIAKYLRQAGVAFSQPYVETALAKNSAIAVKLIELFRTLHDPQAFSAMELRKQAADAIRAEIEALLNDVPSADEDRIIRLFMNVIGAMLRTSFFQPGADGGPKPFLAFKLESGRLEMLPLPKPLYEIFVYSPEVEGVHLRFGKVARGGIRWSDRAEDFRTEVLSLVKAQQVKNAVIVPVGAKGGFYPKRIPLGAPRDVMQAGGIAAYKTFIGALLDLTDNIGPEGNIIPPANVLRYDADDPYLVVAADKGTATFSDIANEIALSRGFWLGDAFASGGSHGYDHKKLGITARGAWEAVKRHFRELKRDIQTEAFTCVGVGDMSGDVFGNAMLLSKETKLVAAFDHRHIFIDPNPEPHAAFTERKRLFDLPRSSWADYNATLISAGGGIFPRTAKEILLSSEVKVLTGLAKDKATPVELMRALLTAQVDLLFFGGIGTFVKSSAQSHADAGDRTNDALRVNGRDIRALVIGEGANLGVTQLGRIEYAREGGREKKGGRINTDAIDNSAGVDTSDHEVNIKILMNGPLRRRELSEPERDSLLTFMAEDVASLVLKDNYDQTLALSVAESTAVRDLDASARFIRELERAGKLDRSVEMLPSDEALRALQPDGKGLTRPELAVLLAYAKLDLFHEVAGSELVQDEYLSTLLADYFPPLAVEHFRAELPRHRLAREIIATELVNRMVNLAGPLFAHRMYELSNAELWRIARAYVLSDGVFALEALGSRIKALDLKVAAAAQIGMMADIAELLRRLGLWFVVQLPNGSDIASTVETYRAGFSALKGHFSKLVSPLEKEATEARLAKLKEVGVPDDVAEDAAILPLLSAVPEIVLLSENQGVAPIEAARAYFAVGGHIGLDRLRALAGEISLNDHWDRLALRRIVDDLYAAQRLLAADALKGKAEAAAAPGANAVTAWAERRAIEIDRTRNFLKELERGGEPTIAKLALANSQIQKLAASTSV
ncbi:MAG TPA: NAD-glutamate dehydrogenase [Micropepsaceae bacterium]|nr:NAD-glutamate dehydrogenase [Micropepsaceae bacterium]